MPGIHVGNQVGAVQPNTGDRILSVSELTPSQYNAAMVDDTGAAISTSAAELNLLDGATAGTVVNGKAVIAATTGPTSWYPVSSGTDSAAGLYLRALNDATSFFTNQTSLRSYLLYVNGNRPSTKPLGAGAEGVDDASVRVIYRSYAADGANVQQRGINVQSRHSGTSGGSIGNLISTNSSTSTSLSNDNVALTCVNENYSPATGGVSGVLDLVYLHEGADPTGTEFGLRIRNQKKNGTVRGAYITFDKSTSTTALAYGIDMNDGEYGTADIRLAEAMVIQSLSTAVSDNDATSLPASSLVVTSHNTGKGTLFISDGSNLQALALA